MASPIRILFIGGKKHNVPADRILCEWEQYEQDSPQLRKGVISYPKDKPFHMILCFSDFIGHGAKNGGGSDGFRQKAKLLDIPFVSASGGMSKLLEAAKKAGHDLYPFFKMSKDRPPKPPSERTPPNRVIEWAKSLPRQAQARIVKDGVRVWVIPNRGGGVSVLLKGKLLDDAVKYVRQHSLGKGTRGGLTPKEAQRVAKYLEKTYEFAKRGITLTHTTVTRNVGVVLDTLSEKVKKDILGKYADGKKAVKAASIKNDNLVAKKQQEAMSPEEKQYREEIKRKIAGEIDSKSKFPSALAEDDLVKLFASDIAQTMSHFVTKLDTLYDRIVDLSRENASYIEHITSLEEKRDALQEKVNELEEEIKQWKRMAVA